MRTITTTINVYKFEELSEKSKVKALDNLWDINVDHDWWENIYEDAETIDCKILEFDIDREAYCKMRLGYEDKVINKILENHGEDCETYKIAKRYQSKILDSDGNIDADIANDFKNELQFEYLSMLRRSYEYLTSEEAILETIEANEYEFTVDGKLI